MANCYGTTRSNYFRVKDEQVFKDLIEKTYGTEDEVHLFEKKDGDETRFGFGTYGSIAGLKTSDDEDIDEGTYDDFVDALQKIVADDDAVIILEAGNEKLNYVSGSATIITAKAVEYLSIADLAAKKAAEMLGNPQWTTRVDY